MQRAIDRFPKQGGRDPWTVRQNYVLDRLAMPRADLGRDMTFVRRRDLPTAPRAVPETATPAGR